MGDIFHFFFFFHSSTPKTSHMANGKYSQSQLVKHLPVILSLFAGSTAKQQPCNELTSPYSHNVLSYPLKYVILKIPPPPL